MASLHTETARFNWPGHNNEVCFLWDTLRITHTMHNIHINHHCHRYHHHRRHTSGHCWRCVLWNVCLKLTTVEQTIKQLSPAFIIVYIAMHRHTHLPYFDLECFLLYHWPCYFRTSFVSNGKIASRNKNSYLNTRLLNFYFPSSIIEKNESKYFKPNLIWSKSHSIFSDWLVVSWKEAISYFFLENSPFFALLSYSRNIVGGWVRKKFLFPFMFVPGPPSKSRRPDRTKSKDVPFVTTTPTFH